MNAPNAKQIVYEAPNTNKAVVDEFTKVAEDDKIDVFSGSWLFGESCDPDPIPGMHDQVNQMVAEGITFISASGDWGGHGCDFDGSDNTPTADYPASDPGVTGVGATRLTTNSDNSYAGEAVWNSGGVGSTRSGGQYSSMYATPTYQKPVNNKKYRSVADVSMAGDPDAGGLALNLNGEWTAIGGTSEAAPLWAGFQANVVHKVGAKMGNINASLYQIAQSSLYATTYHDVTEGNNDTYNAGPGYDLPTGWGSPVGSAMLTALGKPKS